MQARERGLLGFVCALAVAISLAVAPASAGAATRFASPTGGNSPTCPSDDPCALQWAIEVVATVGDEVILAPGTYSETTDPLLIDLSKYVHGAYGQPIPEVIFTNPPGLSDAVRVSGNAVLGRVSIRQTLGDAGDSALLIDGGTAEQVTARTDAAQNSACRMARPGGLLRDSVCWSSIGTAGVYVVATGDGVAPLETVTATLRNTNAIAHVDGSGLVAEATGDAVTAVDARNVIADGPDSDVMAAEDAGDTTTVALENSNYATTSTSGTGVPFITAPGTGTNQTASPAFANAASGNFHQLASSPTVDAGGTFFLMGSLDFDGESRSVDGSPSCIPSAVRPDIGADELVPGALDCLSPETGINDGPKQKTRRRRAGFNFVATELSTFQCSLDEKPFVPCVPPHAYRKLKLGKHEFNVRAVDAAGNIDTSPATRTWRILKKKKKKRKR
jgi:hypothetical protein